MIDPRSYFICLRSMLNYGNECMQHTASILTTAALMTFVCGCLDDNPVPSKTANPQDAASNKSSSSVRISSVFSELATSKDLNTTDQGRTNGPIGRGISFVEVTADAGLEFRYDNGAAGQQLMVEATGGGCGWTDFDRDSYPDIYFPQGGNPALSGDSDQPMDQLFRNHRGLSFQNIAAAAGITEQRYSQGVAVGDFDNDGFDDIFVTNVGLNQLYHNQGDGTFLAVPKEAGFAERHWSSSAAWGDIDLDGDLDVYVCNYCDYDPKKPMPCTNNQGIASICHPKDVVPVPDECYRNLGDGRFETCAQSLGLYGDGNRGLGVVIADFNNDRWPDIYVANDTTANFLFSSDHGAGFREVASITGCALSAQGLGQASMGVACGDYDRNGFLDLYLTHFTFEWNTLYANLGEQGYYDVTAISGLVVPTLNRLAFGTVMDDFNCDGNMELFVANGHINPQEADGDGYPMQPQMFSCDGKIWNDVSSTVGGYFDRKVVGRGVATADFDIDGKMDLCVVHQDSPVVLLHNESNMGSWLNVTPAGTESSRNAVGTRVHATIDGETWMRELAGGTSYCSSMQRVLSFGFPASATTCTLRIEWPNGLITTLESVPLNQSIDIIEPNSATRQSGWYASDAGKK
ncbi:MAG: CRTAC1 family protein [Planctomycetaceae bacterium]